MGLGDWIQPGHVDGVEERWGQGLDTFQGAQPPPCPHWGVQWQAVKIHLNCYVLLQVLPCRNSFKPPNNPCSTFITLILRMRKLR